MEDAGGSLGREGQRVVSLCVHSDVKGDARLGWPTAAALAHGDEAGEGEGCWKRGSRGVEVGLRVVNQPREVAAAGLSYRSRSGKHEGGHGRREGVLIVEDMVRSRGGIEELFIRRGGENDRFCLCSCNSSIWFIPPRRA